MKFDFPAVFSLIVLFNCESVSAQSIQEDSIFYQSALAHTITIYINQLGDQSPLYNGSVYAAYEYNFKTGTPYFPTINFSRGSVVYDGITFDSLSLLYEDLRQLLITKRESLLLQLVNERISSFVISGHSFIRLLADSTNKGISRTGFYEVLYPGKSRVLKETLKSITETASIYEGVVRSIPAEFEYFVKRGSEFHRIRSKGDLLEVFHDHQKEIQRFIKKSKLNFRHDTENTVVRSAEYYDQLTR
jgi:hypothetical protein